MKKSLYYSIEKRKVVERKSKKPSLSKSKSSSGSGVAQKVNVIVGGNSSSRSKRSRASTPSVEYANIVYSNKKSISHPSISFSVQERPKEQKNIFGFFKNKRKAKTKAAFNVNDHAFIQGNTAPQMVSGLFGGLRPQTKNIKLFQSSPLLNNQKKWYERTLFHTVTKFKNKNKIKD